MGKHSAPDPDGVEALTDAVNEVFRGIAMPSNGLVHHVTEGARSVPDPSPRVVEAYQQIRAYVESGVRGPGTLHLALTGEEYGELLQFAIVMAFLHQSVEHPDMSWAGCYPETPIVFYACDFFLQEFGDRGQS